MSNTGAAGGAGDRAIARVSVEAEPSIIRTKREFLTRLEAWQKQGAHVLSPLAQFDAIPASYGILPAVVAIDPNPDPAGPGEVYQDGNFVSGAHVALSKLGLSKIAMAAGMSIVTERVDDQRQMNYWCVRATARYVGIDGTVQVLTGTEERDLRDGSALAAGMTPKELPRARIKGLRGCEARAINAAIRQFGIKQKYTRAELARPFLVVRVVFSPDLADPVVAQQVMAHGLAGASALYPPALAAPSAAAAAPERLDVIGGAPAVSLPAGPGAAAPAGVTVARVTPDIQAGTYDAVLSTGEEVTARSHDLGRALDRARVSGERVELAFDEAGFVVGVKAVRS